MDDKDLTIQRLRAELRDMSAAWERDQQERLQITELLERAKAYPWYFELRALVTDMVTVAGIYDIVEEHSDCTVQILRNSKTGAVSVGWWKNEVKK